MRDRKFFVITFLGGTLFGAMLFYNFTVYGPFLRHKFRKPSSISKSKVTQVPTPPQKPEYENLIDEIAEKENSPGLIHEIKKENTEELKAPALVTAKILEDQADGAIFLRWTRINGASKYQIKVFDQKNRLVRSVFIKGNKTTLKNLNKDSEESLSLLKVQVYPVSKKGELGPASAFREIAMVPASQIAPPSLKSVTTEEQ